MDGLRISVRARTGAPRDRAGGRYGEGWLLVSVGARPVDGAANRAIESVLAAAFGVARSAVTVVSGRASRSKVVAIDGDPVALRDRLDALLRI
jgi:uncharacterized protein YggU (UPF0235/DUF167 family)